MKKRLILAVVMLVGVLSLFSQTFTLESPEKQMTQTVTTNPLEFIFGFFKGSYEMVLSPSHSIQAIVGFFPMSIFIFEPDFFSILGGVGYRYYLSQTAPIGFYVAPKVEGRVDFDTYLGWADLCLYLKGDVGYQWISSSGFVVNLYLEPAIAFTVPWGELSPSIGWRWSIGYGW